VRLCLERRVRHGYDSTVHAAHNIDHGVELSRQRLNEIRAKTGLGVATDHIGLSEPVIGNRQFPSASPDSVRDNNLGAALHSGESMFQRIHYQFGDY